MSASTLRSVPKDSLSKIIHREMEFTLLFYYWLRFIPGSRKYVETQLIIDVDVTDSIDSFSVQNKWIMIII